MQTIIEGGCLCRRVRYRLHGSPKRSSDCHCEDCRRANAAPYVTWCAFERGDVNVHCGQLRKVAHAGRLRSFAACCGTPLFIGDDAASREIDVTVGSLDDPGSVPPQVAILTEDKLEN